MLLPGLESELQAKLHRARATRVHRVQEATAAKAGGITSGVRGQSITANRVACSIAFVRIEDAELGMVEYIEHFSAEFQVRSLNTFIWRNKAVSKLMRRGLFMELRPALPWVRPRRGNKVAWISQQRPHRIDSAPKRIASEAVGFVGV